MTSPFADRLFRITFVLAGIYNLAFGLWAAIWPLAFFQFFDLEPPRYPGIWTCLGMVVGVYGLLYWYAARRLEFAWPIIAVGLLGKVLGPVGMILTFSDDWPLHVGMICIWNDLIWWLPFGLFLVRGTAIGRRLVGLAPWFCIGLHALGLVQMAAVLRHGTLAGGDTLARATYITQNQSAWFAGWATWMLAAFSIVGFYAWWGSELSVQQGDMLPATVEGRAEGIGMRRLRTGVATLAVLLAAFGMVCDLTGEGIYSLVITEWAAGVVHRNRVSLRELGWWPTEIRAVWLTAGAANAFYTSSGFLLMLVTPKLPWWIRLLMCVTWAAGIGMSYFAYVVSIGGPTTGIAATTAILFPSLIVWVAWMALRWRPS